MNAPTRISTEVDDATLARIEAAATLRGLSLDAFFHEALRRASEEAEGFTEGLERGRAEIACGDCQDHDAFAADLRRWRETRVRSR